MTSEERGPAALAELFTNWNGSPAETVEALPLSGSDRRYFRYRAGDRRAIGVINVDSDENHAFTAFSRHFRAAGIRVPEIYAEDLSRNVYLQQDLGDLSLLQLLKDERQAAEVPESIVGHYRESLRMLAEMQVRGGRGLDYSLCRPREEFDARSMYWDLNYFKYYFLKMAPVTFSEEALENDFDRLVEWLLQADRSHFMFRDFQGRNIMIHEGKPYFIDYQGGRRGPLQYDVVSLLYQARAALPPDLRTALRAYYLEVLGELSPGDVAGFREYYPGFVLMRTLQVLGAYGFRGLILGKDHFKESIPYAMDNLDGILQGPALPVELPELMRVLRALAQEPRFRHLPEQPPSRLTVHIRSFSYRDGVPEDETGHGQGYAFDCRALHNPGRYEEYKALSGRNPKVRAFLESQSRIGDFLEHVYALVEPHVERFIERDFEHLRVNFGCTGGQHRSVYCAEALAARLSRKYPVKITLQHLREGVSWREES